MQNAADAGALAGAREICFGDPALAETVALDYAIDRNNADAADADVQDWTVAVTTTKFTDLTFAGIIGYPTVDVRASAMAACGSVRSLCDVWPLSFHIERWETIPCSPTEDCDDPDNTGIFYVFNDGRLEEDDPCYDTDPITGECVPACDILDEFGNVIQEGACACNEIPPDNEAYLIGPGHRGWLNFPRPQPPYDDPGNCAGNCGSHQVWCWIDGGGYSGELVLPFDEGPFCLPGEPGVSDSVRNEIEEHICETPNLLLWDGECDPEDPVEGNCPGTPYHIVGTSCVQILEVLEFNLMRREPYRPPDQCLNNVKVIKARKLCDCPSACGSTYGGPPVPGQVRAVSMLR
jgi:hypothetical protein